MVWRWVASGLVFALSLAGCGGGGSGATGTAGTGDPTGPGNTAVVARPVTFPARANDVVWDAQRQVLYLSLPSAAGPNGNAIVALDPTTNTVVRSQFAGSEPSVLSMSDDGQFLYAGINGSGSVRRFRLPDLTPDLSVPLGRDSAAGAFHAVDLAAVPGSPHAFVAALSAQLELDSVQQTAVFDDATARPMVSNCRCTSFQWGVEGELYAGNNEDTGFNFYALQQDAAGLHLVRDVRDAFTAFNSRIHYSADTRMLYADDGTVFDPVAGRRVLMTGLRGPMVADTARNRLFYATSVGTTAIEALDATTYQPSGTAVTFSLEAGLPVRMVRWGSQGLALTTGEGPVLLFGGSGVSSFSTTVPVGAATRATVPGTVNHLTWNAASGHLYATMSESSANLPGFVVVIDPVTSRVTASLHLGSEPDAIAVSDDGQYLYVGLDRDGTVQRLRLPGLVPDLTLQLGTHVQYGPYVAGDIKVSPVNPRAVAVSRFSPGVSPAEQGGIVVFDDSAARPVSATRAQSPLASYGDLVWDAAGTTLYSSNLIGSDLYVLSVDASGVQLVRTIGGAFATPGHLHRGVGNNLLYHDSGRVVDATTGLPLGRYRPGDNSIGGELVTADAASRRVFTAALLTPAPGMPLAFRIDAFDMDRFTPTLRYAIDDVNGFPFDFSQAGAKAFAFRSSDGISIVTVQ